MTPWATLFKRSTDIALGSPQVIAKRVSMLNQPAPWSPAALLEAQRMVWEKVIAASETWWVLWRAAFALGLRTWQPPRPQRLLGHRSVSTAHRALAPYARRVNANVRRLKKR